MRGKHKNPNSLLNSVLTQNANDQLSLIEQKIQENRLKIIQLTQENERLEREKLEVEENLIRGITTGKAVPIVICECGKRKYSSAKEAIEANSSNQHPMRPYFDSKCSSWHVAKRKS